MLEISVILYLKKILKNCFNYGEVKEVKVIEGRRFGFVEMSSSTEAAKANTD